MIKFDNEEKTVGFMILFSYLFVIIGVYFDKGNDVTYKNIEFAIIMGIISLIMFGIHVYMYRKDK